MATDIHPSQQTQPTVSQPSLHRPHTERLAPAASSLLDLIRLTAALVVFIGHLTISDFLTQFPDIHVIGEYAVPVFFVLSGFVIRFICLSRPQTLRNYLIDRAARVYSIALPAMALTLLLAALCARINHPYYTQHFGAFSNHIVARVLLNLTFLSQSWGLNTIPLIDGPFWSLGYECSYYVGFGFLLYLRGWRRVFALMLWAIISGPQVLCLAPVWLLGAYLFDVYRTIRKTPFASILQAATLLGITLAATLAVLGHPALLLAPFHLVHRFGTLPHPLELLGLPPRRATMLATATGSLATIFILLALLLTDRIHLAANHPWLRRFRRIADGTFAIYLMHYPVMAFAAATGLLRPNAFVLNLTTATVICLLLIAVAAPLDRFKLQIRSALHSIFPPLATRKVAALATPPKR